MRSRLLRAVRSARRGLSEFPMLPASITLLLLGFSLFASLKGGSLPTESIRQPGSVVASRELRSTLPLEAAEVDAPPGPAEEACEVPTSSVRAIVLKPPSAQNLQESAMTCAKSCREHPECNSWRWCEDHFNCKDEYGGIIPYYGCQLRKEFPRPAGLPSNRTAELRKMVPRQSTSGFLQRLVEDRTAFLRMQSAPLAKLLITTYNPSAECTSLAGDRVNLMGIVNKLSYAKWHKYLFNLVSKTEDRSLKPMGSPQEGSWNKIGILNKMLRTYKPQDVEWILWMEPDAVFDNPAFTFPFEHYRGLDVITIADPAKVALGDVNALSTGILLVRNSAWSKVFFTEVANLARSNQLPEESTASDPVAEAMMLVMKSMGLHDALSHFRFEGEFCFGCDWRRIDLALAAKTEVTTVWGEANKNWKLFITRFFDCHMCWPGDSANTTQLEQCMDSYKAHFEFAYCRLSRMAKAIEKEATSGSLLQNLDSMNIDPKGFVYASFIRPDVTSTLLTKPSAFKMNTSQATGCDEAGFFLDNFPYGGCQLSNTNFSSSPEGWYRGPQFSTVASGYISEDHPARLSLAKKIATPAKDRIVFASGIPSAPCMTPHGDVLIKMTVQNKQDYARLYGNEFHNMGTAIDPTLRMGAWQKLGLVRKLLSEIPRSRAEWIMWVDMDTVLQDMSFEIPLSKYASKDFVVWGDEQKLARGDVYGGVNSGIFLIRNSDWSRSFVEAMVPFGSFPHNYTYDELLRDNLENYDMGMYEQNAIAYLAKKQPQLISHIFFEDKFCLNCWYKDIHKPFVKQPPFIVHFAGCQTCTGLHVEKLDACDRELVHAYIESNFSLHQVLASNNRSGVATNRRSFSRQVLGMCDPLATDI